MKISILTHTTEWGGAELHTIEMVKVLRKRGHNVLLIQLGHDLYSRKLSKENNVPVFSLPIKKPFQSLSILECVEILKSVDTDSVGLLPKGTFAIGNWYFDLLARFSFSNYLTIEHLCPDPMPERSTRRHFGGLLPGLGLWWYKELVSRFLRSVGPKHTICVSDAVRNDLIERYRFPPRKLKTIHNGISTEKFRRCEEHRKSARAAWGIRDESLVFGTVGRLSHQKRFDIAIELFGRLASEYPGRDIWFVLVGEGPQADKLKAKAIATGSEARIIFAGYTDKPWEMYSAFDVFLMPSRNEGLPLALMEAMACNCCPISTAVGGISEIISNPGVGWLLEPDDEEGFFSAMKQTLQQSSTQLTEMGCRARKHIVDHFEAAGQYAAVVDFIEEHARNN
jgi:glycosyltransferase involved in cell wall biosynthesis